MAKKELPKNKILVGIKGEPDSFVESRGMVKFYSAAGDKEELEDLVAPAYVTNRFDHNLTLVYDGNAMIIPPRGKVKIANMNKLGSLPKGTQVIPIK